MSENIDACIERYKKNANQIARLNEHVERYILQAARIVNELNRAGVPMDDPRRVFEAEKEWIEKLAELGVTGTFLGLKLVEKRT